MMLCWFVVLPTAILMLVNAEIINSSVSSSFMLTTNQQQNQLHEMLNTEKLLIDIIRNYIETQESKLDFLRRKTFEIRKINDDVTDRERYLHNPINALIILKRFTSDWKSLRSYAANYLETEDYGKQTATLTFPSDEDYDAALFNLLRIQDMYQLEPQHLSVGEVNGIKLGSKMSWSDCWEIGLKSSKNGYQTYAKYWMETALEKLPHVDTTINNNSNSEFNGIDNVTSTTKQRLKIAPQDDYTVKAKLEIMKALLSTEYKLGHLKEALKIANEMLKVQPTQTNAIKAKTQIERKLMGKSAGNKVKKNEKEHIRKENKTKKKTIQTVEQSMIEEFCREANSLQNSKQTHKAFTTTSRNPSTPPTLLCTVVTNNLPFLLMQPLKVEVLSLDPYIVIYHNILSDTKIEELKDFVIENQDGTFEFTKIGHKKLLEMNKKLHYIIGHYGQELYDDWQVERYNFETVMDLRKTSINYETDGQAKLLFNLQQPLAGGSVIFPLLELGIHLRRGSVLYWSTINEFNLQDYRSEYHICPIISGSQLTATTTIKRI